MLGHHSIGIDVRHEDGGALVASGTTTVILGPFNFFMRPTKAFALVNRGTLTLSGAIIQVNPDMQGSESGVQGSNPSAQPTVGPNANMWVNFDTTTFQTMAVGETRVLTTNITALYPWWRVVGVNREPTTIATSGWAFAGTL